VRPADRLLVLRGRRVAQHQPAAHDPDRHLDQVDSGVVHAVALGQRLERVDGRRTGRRDGMSPGMALRTRIRAIATRVGGRKDDVRPGLGTSATAGVSAIEPLRLPHHGNCDRDRGSSRAGQDRGEGPSATLGRPAHSHAARPPPWVTRQARSIEAFDDAWIVRDNALNQASESHPRRRALGPRLAHGALVGVTPRFVVVAVSVHRLFERAGTHVKKPTSGRARSRQDHRGRHESAGQTPAVACPDRRPRRKRAYRARDAIIGARLVPLGSRRSSNGSEVNAERSRSDPT
jgi:hypothetical protein